MQRRIIKLYGSTGWNQRRVLIPGYRATPKWWCLWLLILVFVAPAVILLAAPVMHGLGYHNDVHALHRGDVRVLNNQAHHVGLDQPHHDDSTALPPCPNRRPDSNGVLDLKQCPRYTWPPLLDSRALKLLDISSTGLTELPDIHEPLRSVEILFASNNSLTRIWPLEPRVLPALKAISLKQNRLTHICSTCFPTSLRQLILTDNDIVAFKPGIEQLQNLRKIMLARNHLAAVPAEFAQLETLELIRLSQNDITSIPDAFFQLPRLSWLALAGNPIVAASLKNVPHTAPTMSIDDIDMTNAERLGAGTSGVVYRASYHGQAVAVKMFKAASSDGDWRNEVEVAVSLSHENLTTTIGLIDSPPALVSEHYDSGLFQPLATSPDIHSELRARYSKDRLRPNQVVSILLAVATGLQHMHSLKIAHGDVYAHNILTNKATGQTKLIDFGAAFGYSSLAEHLHPFIQGIDVRAFGILADELAQRTLSANFACIRFVRDVAEKAQLPRADQRPRFSDIVRMLRGRHMCK